MVPIATNSSNFQSDIFVELAMGADDSFCSGKLYVGLQFTRRLRIAPQTGLKYSTAM